MVDASRDDYLLREEIVPQAPDPLLRTFGIAIAAMVILILTVALYGLMAGVVLPGPPKTAREFAIQAAERTVKEKPGAGQYWGDYAMLLIDSGDYRRANGVIKRARKSVKDATLVYVNNAELAMLIKQKKWQQAFDKSTGFIKFDAQQRAKIDTDRAKRGITMPTSVQRGMNTTTIDLLLYRARAADALGKKDEVLNALSIAVRADGTASDVLTMRGYAYLKRGNKKLAKADFETALKYYPEYKPALEGLKKVKGAR